MLASPLLVPLSVAAAGFVAAHRWRRFGLPALALALVLGQVVLIAKETVRGTPAEFAHLRQAVGRGHGCLFVYSGPTMLYPATGRCRVTRYIFPSHLMHKRETGAIGANQEQEIERIFTREPEVVVLGGPFHDERPEQRARVIAHLAQNYDIRARVTLGSETMSVFRLRRDIHRPVARREAPLDQPLGVRELLIGEGGERALPAHSSGLTAFSTRVMRRA